MNHGLLENVYQHTHKLIALLNVDVLTKSLKSEYKTQALMIIQVYSS